MSWPARWIRTIPGAIPTRSGSTCSASGHFLRDQGVSDAGLRLSEVEHLGLAADSIWLTSTLGELRKAAVGGATGFNAEDVWETHGVAEGSATVALRMASELGARVRYESPVEAIAVARRRSTVTLAGGETMEADAVVSALPAGPLRDVRLSGVSSERVASLHALRHSPAIKVLAVYPHSWWLASGRDGFVRSERELGSIWPQIAPGGSAS